jgi:hypothetical protein
MADQINVQVIRQTTVILETPRNKFIFRSTPVAEPQVIAVADSLRKETSDGIPHGI